jgi:N-acetylmuramate 1-kinase
MKNATNDARLNQLTTWLEKLFPDDHLNITVASSDASFRRYFRLKQNDSSYIVMDAPPEHEDISSFIKVDEFLAQYNVAVPHIYAKDEDKGYLLLSDFGDTSFLKSLTSANADNLYPKAIDELVAMQKTNPANTSLPDYDETKLRDEISLFPDWFLSRHLDLKAPQTLTTVYDFIIDEIQQQPNCFVHRDYHSRNLMVCADNTLGIIDFQDAVIGPITYDLVSLLKDCYIQWPAEQQQKWLNYYKEQAINNKLITRSQGNDLQRWFDLTGLQRHLKVLGIFCRLNYRDGKANYLNDLPLTLHYVLEVCERYKELEALYEFLTHTPEIMAIK